MHISANYKYVHLLISFSLLLSLSLINHLLSPQWFWLQGTSKVQGITLAFEEKSLEDKRVTRPNMMSALTYLKEMYIRYFQHGVDEKGGLIINTKQFGLMANLRLLQIINVRLEGDFKHLPAQLKWLQWKNCSLKFLPSGCPPGLTVLDLSESKIEKVWDCRWWPWYWYNNKVFLTYQAKSMIQRWNLRNVRFSLWTSQSWRWKTWT